MGYSEIESLVYRASTDGKLEGNFYMGVKGFSASYYNILVKIYRTDKKTGETSPNK